MLPAEAFKYLSWDLKPLRPWEWAAMDAWEWTMARMVRSEWDEGVGRVDQDQKAEKFLKQPTN